MENLRLLSLFSGIGAFESALERLGKPYTLVNYCEIDRYASTAYAAIHNVPEQLNLGDITKVNMDKLPGCDIITHGSPCQDYSIAGKQAGGDPNTKTRSSLMWHTVEIVKHTRPKYVIWENVKNVLSKNHKHNFDKYLDDLSNLGYNNYYKVLNAKNYGIPQNRERIFVISVRKDIDNNNFKFWEGKDFGIRLKDILEDNIDEKYYLSQEIQDRFKLNGIEDKEHNELNVVGSSAPDFRSIGQRDMTYGTNGIMSTLTATDYKQPKQIIGTNKLSRDGRPVCEFRIRKLTPKECWRLMGFDDTEFNKARQALIQTHYNGKDRANSQLYKMAGNSVVVNVLVEIFKNLF